MAQYNPKWRPIARAIGIDTVVAKINVILQHLQKTQAQAVTSESVCKGTQILLSLEYKALADKGVTLPFDEVEFRNFSQTGEDGILHYIFSLIGTTNKRCAEICAGVGSECNSANLILKHGWDALLVDGNENHVARGKEFFSHHPDSKVVPPLYLQRWITRDNINDILEDAGFSGELDLFSLDMDGVDYWIWDAITAINPRVVVVEYQSEFGEEPVTVPYRDDFCAQWVPLKTQPQDQPRDGNDNAAAGGDSASQRDGGMQFNQYGGASLAAFNKLAKRKGYRLVGANSLGHNAFFIRNDIGMAVFPEVSEQSCYNGLYRERRRTVADELQGFEFERV